MITTLLLSMAANAAEESTDSDANTSHVIDFSIITAGAVGYWAANQIPIQSTTERSSPTGIDGWIEPQWHPEWKWSSDFLGVPYAHYGFNLPVLTVAAATLWGGTTQSDWGVAIPVVQAIAITGTVTEATKRIVERPRPYTSDAFEAKYPDVYNSDDMIALRADTDTFKSFPSGHTSNAAATYFSTAAIIAQRSDDRTTDILAYGTASVLTGLTGYSRVRYGKHHITDTLVGAAIGTGIGLGVTYLYERWH
jgi:membrane-associated phospholipid phosphatase